ncbi:hypothetical protein ERJ75_000050600 [Trypanosoma vivax]|uniref:Uncharacterized protein n=1 Tax=Trypanosoma vivax (strain Y486) TaxID=1055687 RepID=G0U779_TRYVY|nr:hypothetical protein TRVL_06845 [Trypanosoma vivax]KAH8620509.1 hypothetical protein ERJ75_000050600 [Trypanosoma vivax]CCC51736.1 conserved hypothetical protein [Trypanosoma vivax Y486]
MAPKKKVTDVQVLDEKRQTLEFIKRQCNAVESLLMKASEEIRFICHENAVLTKRTAELVEQREVTEAKTDEQVRAMRQMSVTCEGHMQHRLKALQQQVAKAEQENEAIRLEIEKLRERKGKELLRLNNEASNLRRELETRAYQRGVRLRDMLVRN